MLPLPPRAFDARRTHTMSASRRSLVVFEGTTYSVPCAFGEPFGSAWRVLVDAHGPKQAARIFAKVLGHLETRGVREVASRITLAIQRDEPLLLALAPPAPPAPTLGHDLVPAHLRDVEVERAEAADYDRLLVGGDS